MDNSLLPLQLNAKGRDSLFHQAQKFPSFQWISISFHPSLKYPSGESLHIKRLYCAFKGEYFQIAPRYRLNKNRPELKYERRDFGKFSLQGKTRFYDFRSFSVPDAGSSKQLLITQSSLSTQSLSLRHKIVFHKMAKCLKSIPPRQASRCDCDPHVSQLGVSPAVLTSQHPSDSSRQMQALLKVRHSILTNAHISIRPTISKFVTSRQSMNISPYWTCLLVWIFQLQRSVSILTIFPPHCYFRHASFSSESAKNKPNSAGIFFNPPGTEHFEQASPK